MYLKNISTKTWPITNISVKKVAKKSLLLISCLVMVACDSDHRVNIPEEYQHVRVFKDDLANACDDDNTVSVKTDGVALIAENIEIHCAQKGHDGLVYPLSCDSDTGSINIFTIHNGDLANAESLGFSRLSTLPDAQFDEYCEYKVISDHHKYSLLHQLSHNFEKWQQVAATEYKYTFNQSYADCPTFAPTPDVEITVVDNIVTEAIDKNTDTAITELSGFMTIDELYSEIEVSLKLTPVEAGLSLDEPYLRPIFHDIGVPNQYYIKKNSTDCSELTYTLSEVEILAQTP
ncbi:MAG: DUF6174 domain-containing protein [Thalassotalea sp.]